MHSTRSLRASTAGTTRCCKMPQDQYRVGCWWVVMGFSTEVAELTPPKFPGYPDNGSSCQVRLLYRLCCHILTTRCKIHALNWTRSRKPIQRSKLAHEVARKVERYLNRMTVRSYLSEFIMVYSRTSRRGSLRTHLPKIGGGSVKVS